MSTSRSEPEISFAAKDVTAELVRWLAHLAAERRADGIGGRSLMRALAGIRSFARFLERNNKGKVGALAAVRAPKLPKTLPKPLAATLAKAVTDADSRAGEAREQWV